MRLLQPERNEGGADKEEEILKVEKKFKIFLEIRKESQTFATRNEERE